MKGNSFWISLRHELEFCQKAALDEWFNSEPPTNEFLPGDIAASEAGMTMVFNEMLLDMGYTLASDEAEAFHFPTSIRYCVVLRRLSVNCHLVCFLTTFGKSTKFAKLNSSLAQFFGIPIGKWSEWPGVEPIKFHPEWLSQGGAYILGIPVRRRGLQVARLPHRTRLYPSELDRLEKLMKQRFKHLPSWIGDLRKQQVKRIFGREGSYRLEELDRRLLLAQTPPPKPIPRLRVFGGINPPLILGLPRTYGPLGWLLDDLTHNFNTRSSVFGIPNTDKPRLSKMPPAIYNSVRSVNMHIFAPFIRTLRLVR